MSLTENAIKVLEKRYFAKDENGKLLEDAEGMFRRIAKAITEADLNYVDNKKLVQIENEFYNMMVNLEFLPNSPTLMNAGRPLGQLSACFVLPVEDTMEGIFESIKNAALIHKSGGGTGFSFSRLRHKGATVKSTGGVASGPVSFMKVFNAATEAVKQGGTRRGANMGILRVDHPDIREFITCKQDNKDITNFNISVGITEDFMKAVENNEQYDLIDPKTGNPYGKENAKEIFNIIIDNAWNNGEPGIIFLDRINKHNATPKLGEIESTNPCFHPDVLISTTDGLISIKELYEKYSDEEFDIFVDNRVKGNTVIRNYREYMINGVIKKKAKVFKTGVKKTVKVTLNNGQEIKVTFDHRILTLEGWKEAGQLSNDDYVLVQSGKGGFGDMDGIDKQMSLFLGWVTGDGCMTSDGDVVGLNTWQVMYKKEEFIAKLKSYGLSPLKAPNKRVPKVIFSSSEEAVKAYLNGLFSADGTVNYINENHRDIRLSSASEYLLKDVQLLLLNLGIFSSIYKREKVAQKSFKYIDKEEDEKTYTGDIYYEIIINGDDMFNFSEVIGDLVHKEKNIKLKKAAKLSRKKTKFVSRVLAVEEAEEVEVFDINEEDTHSLIAQGIVAHNCGEQPLLPYEACNLGSINLSIMVKKTEQGSEVDFERLSRVVKSAVHFLDNVIDVNKYPLDEIDKMTRGTRKIGLGVMGWADLLCKLGIPYNSNAAIELAEKVMGFIQGESKKASEYIAKAKGVFPYYDQSVYKDENIKIRNATTTTIAPTGTLSIIAGVSSGIEPLFALSFIRNVMDNDELVEVNPVFKEIAVKRGFYSEELMRRIAKKGTIKGFSEIPKDIQDVFVTSHDIDPKWHVEMQAIFQRYTDNAVSKTVNLRNEATKEDVKTVFELAYSTGCKGVTIYRDGSRDFQVLNIGSVKGKEKDAEHLEKGTQKMETASEKTDNKMTHISPRTRPDITTGFTEKVRIGCGNLYITVNYDERGICEVFTNLGRGGGCPSQSEATSRLLSIALRSGMDVKALVEQLKGIRCATTIKQRGLKVMSCPDAIGRVIEKVMKLQSNGNGKEQELSMISEIEDNDPGTETVNQVCPECGKKVEHEGGCVVCRNCGYSKCG